MIVAINDLILQQHFYTDDRLSMRLKELEGYLQQLDTFDSPKVLLEQYGTTPHIASHMLYTIHNTFDELNDKVIADFGSGCGVLSVGASMLGAVVLSLDIDTDAIGIAAENVNAFEVENIDFLQMDLTGNFYSVLRDDTVDTVIMNPPFGTKNNKGVDMKFLQNALSVASNSVYSLHKTSTRDYILKKSRDWNAKPEVLAELRFNLPRTYKFHRRETLDIAVDLIRFQLDK